jgi:hypothetical protein
MVKLIRLQGNGDVNTEEIRNTFKQPIIIGPNAKVALVGASAILNDEIVNENFVIGASNKYFKIGHKVGKDGNKLYQAEITNGSYAASQFVEAFGTAANYAASDSSAFFLQHVTSIVDNKMVLETHRCLMQNANFDNSAFWFSYSGTNPAAKSATGLTAPAGGLEYNMGARANCTVPMFHNKFQATLVNCSGGATFSTTEYNPDSGEPDNEYFGVNISTANLYNVIIPDPEGTGAPDYVSLGQNWAANDVLTFETFGGNIKVNITDASGNSKVSYNQPNKIPRSLYAPGAYGLDWNVVLAANGQISNCTMTYLVNLPDQGQLGDVETQGLLQFVTPSNTYNTLLATFCGFGMNGASIIPYKGNPARLQAREELLGLASFPGILITVDGLGPLESFDGSSDSRSQSNIVYVINDLSVVTSNQLQLDIPAPFYLNLKNSAPININELRARFLPSSGSVTNKAISFSGKPSLTLLIDG